ncbi:MAG: glucokinase [Azospirillaceae bacterium]|nr:glucokinase [Azospirillaceae bacterium]
MASHSTVLPPDTDLSLVADIGATNARFGLIGPQGLIAAEILPCAGHPSLEAAILAFLAAVAPDAHPRTAAVAFAGPVTGDRISLTNHPWTFSREGARRTLGLERLEVVNDFTAVALSIPLLSDSDRIQIGTGTADEHGTIGIIGAGTGLGVSGLVFSREGWIALSGEGGHVTMSPITERESAVLARMRQHFGHVSAERLVSGSGLVNLYQTLSELDGIEPRPLTPADVSEFAIRDGDPLCTEALDMFCAMLGTVAGNLALSLGARGGIYIAGGIVPRFATYFAQSQFRHRFVDKGRLRGYLAPIPTYLVTHELPAFLGLQAVLQGVAPVSP